MNPELHAICQRILDEGRQRFGAMMGIVSHVHDGSYDVMAVSSATGIPMVGDRYPLDSVYCRQVVEQGHSVAITEIDGKPGMSLHPLYDAIPCEFYLSSPILLHDRVWGTLNYTSLDVRDTPFSAEDITYNESRATVIAGLLTLLDTEAE
ncbi:MAG: hypothetical protein RIR00_119 [Pseudomonadota bacterium]|jgi:GAF domain-containing protein